MRIILFLTFILLFLAEHIQSQDSTFTKSIQTKEFELLTEFSRTFIYKSGLKEKQTETKYLFDCNKITPLSDSSYRVNHNSGCDTLLYKNINQITFYGKRKLGKGLMWGAITGAGIGAILTVLIITSDVHGEGAIGKAFAIIFTIPIFAVLGTVAGGIAGLLSFEKEEYDFTKFTPGKRKEMTFKIMLKHQIYF